MEVDAQDVDAVDVVGIDADLAVVEGPRTQRVDLPPGLALIEREREELRRRIEGPRPFAPERSRAQAPLAVDFVDPFGAPAGVGVIEADSGRAAGDRNDFRIELRHRAPAQIVGDAILPVIADDEPRGVNRGADGR